MESYLILGRAREPKEISSSREGLIRRRRREREGLIWRRRRERYLEDNELIYCIGLRKYRVWILSSRLERELVVYNREA